MYHPSGIDVLENMPQKVRDSVRSSIMRIPVAGDRLAVIEAQVEYASGVKLSRSDLIEGAMPQAAATAGDEKPKFSVSDTKVSSLSAKRAGSEPATTQPCTAGWAQYLLSADKLYFRCKSFTESTLQIMRRVFWTVFILGCPQSRFSVVLVPTALLLLGVPSCPTASTGLNHLDRREKRLYEYGHSCLQASPASQTNSDCSGIVRGHVRAPDLYPAR